MSNTDSDKIVLTKDELKELVRDAVDETVKDIGVNDRVPALVQETVDSTLRRIGFEPGDLQGIQRDVHFLRQLRETHELVKHKSLLVLVSTLIVAGLSALWIGLKALV